MNRETSSLISIETIQAIIKKELGVNLHNRERWGKTYCSSKNNNVYIAETTDFRNIYFKEAWLIEFSKRTKSGVDLEIRNHFVKTEKELLDLIKKFKKVRKLI